MVKCNYMNLENLDEFDTNAKAKAIAHYGDHIDLSNCYSYLFDEEKICDVGRYWSK
mgnify:FL=1